MGIIKSNMLIFPCLKNGVALVQKFFFASLAGGKNKGLKWERVADIYWKW